MTICSCSENYKENISFNKTLFKKGLIRELHVYGSLVGVDHLFKNINGIQHKGIGKKLIKKAENIALLDLREISSVADYFVIVTGSNEPHLRAIVDEITEKLRLDHNVRPFSTDGARITPWIVLDFIDVLVHVMNDEFRELYDLENLWGDGGKIDFKSETSPIGN